MAEKVEYVVKIVGLGGKTDTTDDLKEDKNGLASGIQFFSKALHPIQSLTSHSKDEKGYLLWVKEAARYSTQLIETAVPLEINRYFKLSEDYKSQNYLTNVMSNINRAKNLGGAVISGAMTASVVGPVGAVVGAILGGGISLATQGIQWNNTVANFNSSMNATRVETAYRAKRAGLYNGGKGTEN